ncbi:hypothetical protein EON64_10710, partial [archaeon]
MPVRTEGIIYSYFHLPILQGSFGSMIGTSANLTVQGLMQAERNYSFPFFAPFPIGIVCFVAMLFYQIVAGMCMCAFVIIDTSPPLCPPLP